MIQKQSAMYSYCQEWMIYVCSFDLDSLLKVWIDCDSNYKKIDFKIQAHLNVFNFELRILCSLLWLFIVDIKFYFAYIFDFIMFLSDVRLD